MKRIAFFDWDGTLSADGEGITPETAAALAAFRRAGNLAVLCTGRCLSFIPAAAWALKFDGVIAAAGANVLWGENADGVRRLPDGGVTGKWVHRAVFPSELVREVLATYEMYPDICCKLEGETRQFYLHPLPGQIMGDDPVITGCEDYFERFGGQYISKLTTFRVRGSFPDLPVLEKQLHYMRYAHPYQEACLPGETKSTGIRHLLSALSMPPSAAIAFGDSENDWDMLRFVADSVAMGNAPETVRAAAHRVAPPSRENGVAAVLQEYC